MSQISEIPASAYTPEMETLPRGPTRYSDVRWRAGAGEPEPVDPQDATVATSPIAGHRVPGQIRDEPDARLSVRVASRGCYLEEQLRDTTVRRRGRILNSCVPQPSSLRFTGLAPPLDARYQTATLGAQLVRSLLVSPHRPGTPCRGLSLTPWDFEAWRTYPGREVAELHTRSRLLMRGYWFDRYFLGERFFDTPVAPAQRRVPHAPPWHMCLLEGLTREDLEVEYRGFSANDFLSVGDFPSYFAFRMQARLPEILEYTQITDTITSLCDSMQERKTHKTAAYYRVEAAAGAGAAAAPTGPVGVVLGDVLFPPGMEVVLDPSLGLGSSIIIPADLRQAPPRVQLDPEHATHVPAQRYQEICQRFGFARSYIGRLYSERHELVAEAPVSSVQRCEPTPGRGRAASDEAGG
ncbi:hypothetical protein JCGZ_13195 [Jatropha curcas]|uniref:Aminotransferase-like plant mobile domain-containing protein n=1 Tax=Jatropha curcas TaxID=180498 RepID=A0A067KNK3_JATCU|nr:hypothetical protein JCGZ_13195 [Jatropha curcas]